MVRVCEILRELHVALRCLLASGSDGLNHIDRVLRAQALGSLFKSRKAATASTFDLQMQGIKIEVHEGAKGDAASTIARVTTSIGMR